MEEIINYYKRKRLLFEQMEMLSKKSKEALPEHECDYAHVMVEIEKVLLKPHPIFITIFCCVLVKTSLSFFKKFNSFIC